MSPRMRAALCLSWALFIGAISTPVQAGTDNPLEPLPQSAGSLEVNSLYFASVLYGIEVGLALDSLMGLKLTDPALFLLLPTTLAVGAPVGAHFLYSDHRLRGKPAAVVTGMALGGLVGLSWFGLEHTEDLGGLGFAGDLLAGTTLGIVGGLFAAEYQRPSPRLSALVLSGAVWGSALGGLTGLALAPDGSEGDSAIRGGAIGLGIGTVAMGLLSMAYVPSASEISWMWAGAGFGAIVSTPILMFYAKDGGWPVRRGFLYTAATSGLGAIVAGTFGPKWGGELGAWQGPDWLTLHAIAPMVLPGGGGLTLSGSLL